MTTEKPIIFKPELINPIFDGYKTQTRRVAGLKEINKNPDEWVFLALFPSWKDNGFFALFLNLKTEESKLIRCPYGAPGGRLWVREKHRFETRFEPVCGVNPCVYYHADGKRIYQYNMGMSDKIINRNRPSIHMPRWASRLDLDFLKLRVERLQDITEADAIAEGISENDHTSKCYYKYNEMPELQPGCEPECHCGEYSYVEFFKELWESINGLGSWKTNPWLWVLDFAKVDK